MGNVFFLFLHYNKQSGNNSKIKVRIETGRCISILLQKNLLASFNFHLWKMVLLQLLHIFKKIRLKKFPKIFSLFNSHFYDNILIVVVCKIFICPQRIYLCIKKILYQITSLFPPSSRITN